jgi:hypothetical protein
MRYRIAELALISISLLTVSAFNRPHAAASNRSPEGEHVPVVVELFTSEGCSSCPPADALLAKLDEQPFSENVQLIALEEHVDYWDELGWKDPFSSRDWTSRQYIYSGVLGNRNPYTPQMVVDGTVEFVGNHPQKARLAILEAAGKAKIPVTLTATDKSKAGSGNFHVQVSKIEGPGKHDAAEVWLAITETGLHSEVKRGENAGEDLHHAAVVRSMRKIGEAKAGSESSFVGDASVPIQQDWKRENLRAVVFVQEKKSRRIIGASEIQISR